MGCVGACAVSGAGRFRYKTTCLVQESEWKDAIMLIREDILGNVTRRRKTVAHMGELLVGASSKDWSDAGKICTTVPRRYQLPFEILGGLVDVISSV